jgi:glycosyltransferase involved in cell wall biosynthesis
VPGWEVEALSTCARDAATWADWYPAGRTTLHGVTVRRFPVTGRRAHDFDAFSTRVLTAPWAASPADEQRWIDLQGPVAPDLLDAIRTSDADLVAFYPYLYHPTVHGIDVAGERAVLHPAAHDEPPIHLPLFREVFAKARGLVFHTEHERRFVERTFPVAHHRQIVMGLGADAQPGDAREARVRVGLGDRPYLLCLGRVDDGKGAAALGRFFAEYKARRPSDLALVFAGPVVHQPSAHPDIVVTGAVDESTKWGLLRGAEVLVSPSAYESFSIVLVEAWNVGIPVIVNGRCAVTREHVERSGGGLWYEDYLELEVALDAMCGSASLRTQLAGEGAAYVDAHYRWDRIIDRYVRFLGEVAAHAAR